MTDPGALGPSERQAYYNGLAEGRREVEVLRQLLSDISERGMITFDLRARLNHVLKR